ncbi:dipeptide ABC transporter ATP-binding protein [Kineococcus rhizosphaerae]|uniref:Peptide/nickel transport system ATP-binding protein n=1 Tax=Kineococcus rhizosphaerae TaxID=559628 RepID=A0A2T0QXZ3_9ACTN|nr:ABC transporter ATP-binding protein [Kineococcus rhizosphaerae]PRY11066.1 peptide/nickel transport system ATP-binding protein [Kineococcus rhizosphaerae]
MNEPLLRVQDLSVAYHRTPVVSGVSFEIPPGGSLALIGESGSGKSTIARSVLRLLPRHTARATGTVQVQGTDVLRIPERRFRPLRGRTLGFVPQDPATALNAVRRIGSQAQEAAALTGERDRRARRHAVLDVFERVGLPDPERVYDAYPHELSGGMLQRVLIGLTVLPRPALLVADEPTSALDVTIQRRVLDLLTDLRTDLGIGLLLITHDLAIAAERAERIVVLRDGRVEEAGSTTEVFTAPRSQYARDLQADVPALNPDRYRRGTTVRQAPTQLELRGVTKTFATGTRALDDVSFAVTAGTTHALVGESGSGKTTAVRVLLGLEEPEAGQVLVAGEVVAGRSHAELRATRRHLQLVYQNPFTSLDPTWRLDAIVREPLDRYGIGDRAERDRRVAEALGAVGLDEHLWRRRPTALSGGQRQRVAIARSLVLRPDVVVLDEPTSALDVSVQADIVEVLVRLQRELGLTYLFVSHDLALVRQFADTVTVLRHGRVVEEGTVEQVLTAPREEYSRTLVAAIPRPALPTEPVLEPRR